MACRAILIALSLAASVYTETIYYNGFSLTDELSCHQPGWPPMSEEDIDTKFYIYTRSHSRGRIVEPGDLADMTSYGFDPQSDTYIYTHGFISDSEGNDAKDIYAAYIDVADANVFAVDWRDGANGVIYREARQNIRVVGNQIAIFAEALDQNFNKIHLVGHSLGAHASGYAGEALRNKGITVTRITGLDPAGPSFSDEEDARCRLDPTDADFVDNIHTDDNMYGSDTDMGHVDFYPNGGASQPGCILDVASCSHNKVKLYYEESIRATSCKFTSYECSSWVDYDADQCTDCGGFRGCCNYMGLHATASCSGRRYVKTNGNPQYCIA